MNIKLVSTAVSSLCFTFVSFAQQQLFTTVGANSFAVPNSVLELTVEAIGGGGGGGRVYNAGTFEDRNGGGGGGGAYIRSYVVVNGGNAYNVTVGAAGYSRNGSSSCNSGAIGEPHGGDSFFDTGTDALAKGGNTATGNGFNSGPGAIGGAAATSNARHKTGTTNTAVKFSGGTGGSGDDLSAVTQGYGGGGGGAAGSTGNGNSGSSYNRGTANNGAFLNGSAFSGDGGNGGQSGSCGSNGSNYGGGGGGSSSQSSTQRNGGIGGQGIVLLTWSELTSYACPGTMLTLTGSNLVGVSEVTFNGTPVTFTVNGTTQIEVPLPPNGGTYIVTTTYGRAKIDYGIIGVTASPAATICEGEQITLSGTGATTYSWSDGITDGVPFSPSAGIHTYTVTGSSSGCSASASYTVTVNPAPVISLTGTTSYCVGEAGGSLVCNVPQGFNGTFLWSNGATTPSVSSLPAGNYCVTVTDNLGGCTATACETIVENPVPTVTIGGILSYCTGESTTLTASGGNTYEWNNGLTDNPLVVSAAGVYTVTATDVNGCTGTASETVTESPAPVVTLSQSPNLVCVGQTLAVITAVAQPGVTYSWSTGSSSDTTQTMTGGTITVTATLGGCSVTGSHIVNAAPVPVINVGSTKNSCCGDIVLNPNPDTTFSYVWSTGSTDASITINGGNTLENEVYTVTATNSFGCVTIIADTVNIWCVKPQGTASPDTIMFGNSSDLSVTTDYVGSFAYAWKPDSGLSATNGSFVTSNALKPIVYRVIVTDVTYGCIDSVDIELVVIAPGIEMPNAFTPNGDGVNDTYFPVYFGTQTTVLDFRVYNRWGATVHSDPTTPWDGRLKGEEQPSEVYTYYVRATHPDPDNPSATKETKKQGSFTLLR